MEESTSGPLNADSFGHSRVCQGLSDDEINRIVSQCSLKQLIAGEALETNSATRFSIYTLMRGRLRMYYLDESGDERFIGFVNQGDTIGQSSFLFEDVADEIKIVADIASEVAVLNRDEARTLIPDIPLFRKNLIDSFGDRAASMFRGTRPRRTSRVIGLVSTCPKAVDLLVRVCQRLKGANESCVVVTSRPDDFEADMHLVSVPESVEGRELRSRIISPLAANDRALIDIAVTPGQEDLHGRIASFIDQCDEVLWCFDNGNVDRDSEALLARLVTEFPEWKSRVTCVQMLSRDEIVGRRQPVCAALLNRDFVLPAATQNGGLLFNQGINRIVRHLRGVKQGLAFGGGGARGMSHLGVLQTFDQEKIDFDLMSGTSVGAMVGLGYAAGLSTEYLIDSFARELKPDSWLDKIPWGRRLFVFGNFQSLAWEKMLRRHYHDWTFEQLPVPFSVVTTDLVAGQQCIRNSGDIVDAILESINVPILAKPILKNGKILVDGGVLNNLPVALLNNLGAEYVVGVEVSKDLSSSFAGNLPDTPTNRMKKPGTFEMAQRVMDVSRRGVSRMQMELADQVIEPDTSAFDFADFTLARDIAKTGEAATNKVLPQIRAAINEMNPGCLEN